MIALGIVIALILMMQFTLDSQGLEKVSGASITKFVEADIVDSSYDVVKDFWNYITGAAVDESDEEIEEDVSDEEEESDYEMNHINKNDETKNLKIRPFFTIVGHFWPFF